MQSLHRTLQVLLWPVLSQFRVNLTIRQTDSGISCKQNLNPTWNKDLCKHLPLFLKNIPGRWLFKKWEQKKKRFVAVRVWRTPANSEFCHVVNCYKDVVYTEREREYYVSVHNDSFGDPRFDCQIQWGTQNCNGIIWQTVYSIEHSISSKAISFSAIEIPHIM